MKTQPDNPPAFSLGTYNQGMTRRDYFAAKAMQALLARPDWTQERDQDYIAERAYKQADAMLAEREKGQQ